MHNYESRRDYWVFLKQLSDEDFNTLTYMVQSMCSKSSIIYGFVQAALIERRAK